ncbi:heat-shock protein HslJ [Edwardsiella hoshinae]|uniref:Heat shock protein HslJ n=1 Tax=Edwardsiella hoshinae TaxID=93378 RepID=A0A376DF60_9GAMM|nr:META domain-containing protein [Edwardsiella hoshinae]AOV96980.1 heat-shock protein HslJ [Edwardsiella hoshinae]QPR27168.1 META domain-containing protein [Edwardsiella hoshinae]STC88281.1 Heat shock protein hslJ [Edwardsiella hoshinae]
MRILLLLGVCALLGGCRLAPTAAQLQHHHYVLQAIDGRPIAGSAQRMTPDLEFGQDLWLSATLCGQLSGQATLHAGHLRVANLHERPAPCADPAWQAAQHRLAALLRQGGTLRWRQAPDHLELRDRHGQRFSYRLRDWL